MDAIGGARRENRVAGDQATDIVKMKAIDIFIDRNCFQHVANVDMRRQRQLHKNAVNVCVPIELFDQREHISLAGVCGQRMME